MNLYVFDTLNRVRCFPRQNKLVQFYRVIAEAANDQFVIQVPAATG